MEITHLKTPLGILEIVADNEGVASIQFVEKATKTSVAISANTKRSVVELQEYFDKKRKTFSFKLNPKGTDFQQKVWKELKNIPFGKTASYQQMATNLGDPKVIRAAAAANGKNPISIVIPCHRVIGSDGSLTGYAGGLHRKKWLLAHESPVTQGELF